MARVAVREAAQAGRFYSGDSGELSAELEGFFGNVKLDADVAMPKGLIAPHAGYTFSGQTAAYAYEALRGKAIERVVIFAPSHYTAFVGGSVFNGSAYRTPLGKVPLDGEAVDTLLEAKANYRFLAPAHQEEHSLEVQLPFLQQILGNFLLVPVLVGDQRMTDVLSLAEEMADTLDGVTPRSTVFVASSDLYHGGSLKQCERQDARLQEFVEAFDPQALIRNVESGNCMACGYGPMAAVMWLAKHYGAESVSILKRTNSFEAHPVNDSYVVGYLAGLFV